MQRWNTRSNDIIQKKSSKFFNIAKLYLLLKLLTKYLETISFIYEPNIDSKRIK